MPYYRKAKNSTRKKVPKKRSIRDRTVRNYSIPMPPQTKTVMKFVAKTRFLESANTNAAGSSFSLGSMYDPAAAGGTGQPLGFDEMNLFYRYYRVDKVQYKVQFHSPDQDGMKVLIYPRRAQAGYSAAPIERIAEFSRAKIKIIATDTPLKNGTFTGTIDMARLLGITKEKHRVDDIYSASFDEVPDNDCVMDVMCQFKDNASAHKVYYQLEFLYHCTFFGLKTLIQS